MTNNKKIQRVKVVQDPVGTHYTIPSSTGCNEADSIYEEITEETYEMVKCSGYELLMSY